MVSGTRLCELISVGISYRMDEQVVVYHDSFRDAIIARTKSGGYAEASCPPDRFQTSAAVAVAESLLGQIRWGAEFWASYRAALAAAQNRRTTPA